MQYRRDIDGLRALAVLPVLFFHLESSWLPGGFAGVDVFFVISGYLITGIINTELETRSFSFQNFYLRRARRILPALVATIAACLIASICILTPERLEEVGRTSLFALLFSSNFYFSNTQGYFDADADLNPLLHTWSLGVEEQYYILIPVIFVLLNSRERRFLGLVVVALASFLAADWFSAKTPNQTYYMLPYRMWELGVGGLLALLPTRKLPLTHRADLLCLVGLVLLLCSYVLIDSQTPWPGRYALLSVLGAALVLGWGGLAHGPIVRVLRSEVLVRIGLISYSLYLVHQPVIVLGREVVSPETNRALFAVAVVMVALGLAVASYQWVEKPFRTPGGFQVKRWPAGSVVGVLFAGIFLVIGSQGLPSRFNSQMIVFMNEHAHATNHSYVQAEANELVRDTWPQRNGLKLLIVGDSFSKDVFNALNATMDLSEINVVIYDVPVQCQIYLPDMANPNLDVTELGSEDSEFCHVERRVRGAVNLFPAADLVVFASRWKRWSGARINLTLSNLPIDAATRVVVVGAKSFPAPDLFSYAELSHRQRSGRRFKYPKNTAQLNQAMSDLLATGSFVDPMLAFCDAGVCREFADSEHLMSYDAKHLTPWGAAHLGNYLLKNSPLRCLLSKECLPAG